jgi:hypothetical protein
MMIKLYLQSSFELVSNPLSIDEAVVGGTNKKFISIHFKLDRFLESLIYFCMSICDCDIAQRDPFSCFLPGSCHLPSILSVLFPIVHHSSYQTTKAERLATFPSHGNASSAELVTLGSKNGTRSGGISLDVAGIRLVLVDLEHAGLWDLRLARNLGSRAHASLVASSSLELHGLHSLIDVGETWRWWWFDAG